MHDLEKGLMKKKEDDTRIFSDVLAVISLIVCFITGFLTLLLGLLLLIEDVSNDNFNRPVAKRILFIAWSPVPFLFMFNMIVNKPFRMSMFKLTTYVRDFVLGIVTSSITHAISVNLISLIGIMYVAYMYSMTLFPSSV